MELDGIRLTLPASDYIFLVIVIAIIGGIAYAVKGASVQDGINKQKEAMKVIEIR